MICRRRSCRPFLRQLRSHQMTQSSGGIMSTPSRLSPTAPMGHTDHSLTFGPGTVTASMFCEHLADVNGAALVRPVKSVSSGGIMLYSPSVSQTCAQAQRPASLIWSRDFQRDEARVVVMTFIPCSRAYRAVLRRRSLKHFRQRPPLSGSSSSPLMASSQFSWS